MTPPVPQARPRPETTIAVLASAGFEKKAPTPTWHDFVETKLVSLPHGGGQVWAFVFQCRRTGATRIWGNTFVEGTVREDAVDPKALETAGGN